MSRAQTFFNRANEKYNYKFDYSKSEYSGHLGKMVIICPAHGEFIQTARGHLETTYGCKECQVDSQRKTKERFINDAIAIHGDTYDYSKVEYVNDYLPVTIICNVHGEFTQAPGNHTGVKRSGCRKCADDRTRDRCRKDLDVFLHEVANVTTSAFTIIEEYVNDATPIEVLCQQCGQSSYVVPSNILRGQGCSNCANHGFKPSKSAMLYFFKIKGLDVYKIGITNNSIESRYNKTDLVIIENRIFVEFPIGADARKIEKYLLNKYKEYKYIGPDLLSSGNTELLTIDIAKEVLECQKIYQL